MNRAGTSIAVQLLGWTGVVAGSVLVALVLFELMMQNAREGTVAMRVTPNAYGVFDPELGVRYEPGTSISYAYLDSKGRVLDCLSTISRTNADGFRGLDTRADYTAAAHKVLVSGDSFSHWNVDGMTLVDYTKSSLNERGIGASLLNVAGGTFGLEHMVVHLAAAIEDPAIPAPDLVSIQFIRDDITRGWWYLDTRVDDGGRPRARLGSRVECLAPDSDCGSDEYLLEPRATQSWCEGQKGTGTVDALGEALVATYDEIRGFFVYTQRVFARLGLTERRSVIPRVVDIGNADTDRIRRATDVIRDSGARVLLVYLPDADEIRAGQAHALDANERAILELYERQLGVAVTYPDDYTAFDGVDTFAVSPYDSHPSAELQRAYGAYLADHVASALN